MGGLGGLGGLGDWAGRRSCQGGSHPLGVVSVFICPGWGKSPKEELREIVRQRLVSSRRWAVKARSRGPAGDSTGCHRAPATSEDPRPQQSRCGSGPGVLWRGHTWHVQTLPADGLLLWPGRRACSVQTGLCFPIQDVPLLMETAVRLLASAQPLHARALCSDWL